ncbi:DUF5412 family protein [Clostridium butanoliproducens]|uniref:DUF5412 family protein n=1 Tax=Clostridium butanoliproducens TaxID=2991837 RepID=UPI0024BB10F5|nr:DUF5412 family protein [Clostridium butanoliproducens]
MRKRKIIFMMIIIPILIIGYIIYHLFFSLNNLPEGVFLNEFKSPKGTYTVRAYICNGGATVDYAIRAELIENNKKNSTKNFYWEYKAYNIEVEWIDETTININNHIIYLPNGSYDWRREKIKI